MPGPGKLQFQEPRGGVAGGTQKALNAQMLSLTVDLLLSQLVKNPPAVQETLVRSLGQEDPLEKVMATHSSILLGKSHRQRSLAGSSPWDHRESDTTE